MSNHKSKKDRVVTEVSNATSHFNETKKMFSFHPGTFDFGKKGFWTEGWKCCGRAWRDEGCKKTKIDPNSALKLLICYNHGEINPVTNKPDSICGCVFPRNENLKCKFHKGYYDESKSVWTCCRNGKRESEGCVRDQYHESAFQPIQNSSEQKFLLN